MRVDRVPLMRLRPESGFDPSWAVDEPDHAKASAYKAGPQVDPLSRRRRDRRGRDSKLLPSVKEAGALLGYGVLPAQAEDSGQARRSSWPVLDRELLNAEAVEKYKADIGLWRKQEIIRSAMLRAMGAPSGCDGSWRRVALCKNCKARSSSLRTVDLQHPLRAVNNRDVQRRFSEVDQPIADLWLIDPFPSWRGWTSGTYHRRRDPVPTEPIFCSQPQVVLALLHIANPVRRPVLRRTFGVNNPVVPERGSHPSPALVLKSGVSRAQAFVTEAATVVLTFCTITPDSALVFLASRPRCPYQQTSRTGSPTAFLYTRTAPPRMSSKRSTFGCFGDGDHR